MATSSTASLGSAIRQRRRDLGLTQAEVADLGAVSVKFVIDLERGKRSVRLDKVADVLDVLGLTLRVEVRQ
ncbi:MAG: type II toxin-antitoxin system Y4mF family antitoxin [Dermatophilaceae bacterium]